MWHCQINELIWTGKRDREWLTFLKLRVCVTTLDIKEHFKFSWDPSPLPHDRAVCTFCTVSNTNSTVGQQWLFGVWIWHSAVGQHKVQSCFTLSIWGFYPWKFDIVLSMPHGDTNFQFKESQPHHLPIPLHGPSHALSPIQAEVISSNFQRLTSFFRRQRISHVLAISGEHNTNYFSYFDNVTSLLSYI